MELELRPATMEDAAFAADVYTAVHPQRPADPVVTRHSWEHPGTGWTFGRRVVVSGGRPIGIASFARPPADRSPRPWIGIDAELLPAHRDRTTLAAVLERIERPALDGARASLIRGSANEDDPVLAAALESRGFREDRRSRRWELDLVAHRDRILRMADASRSRMREQGIDVHTLDRDGDPDVVRRVWRLSQEAIADIPTTVPYVEETVEDYEEWFASPDMHRDRVWIARLDGEVVGISTLEYPPVRGVVGTAWTGTARSVRGRGIARALKCETLAQAIELGVDRVRTGNDAQNAPILHINETMGYRPIPGRIGFLKDI